MAAAAGVAAEVNNDGGGDCFFFDYSMKFPSFREEKFEDLIRVVICETRCSQK